MSGGMSALEGTALTPQVSDDSADRVLWPTPETPEWINTQNEPVSTRLIEPSYDFNIERDTDGNIVGVLAKTPDGATQQPLSTSDSLYHRSVDGRTATHQQVVWRNYWVDSITKTAANQLEATLVFHPDATTHEAATEQIDEDDRGRVTTVSVPELCEELIASRHFADPPSSWHTTAQKWRCDKTAVSRFEERYVPVGTTYEPVESCSDLSFERITGDGSREIVDDFLNGDHTPAVEHNLGDTGAGYLAAFGAYHTPDDADERNLIAVLTLDEHPNRDYFQKHNAVLISRIAAHPHRPKNTSTWLIARSRDWAADAGYDQIGSTAGVRYNRGIVYKAAGFELDADLSGWASGDGWQNRPGRTAVRNGDYWYKRKWVDSLQ